MKLVFIADIHLESESSAPVFDCFAKSVEHADKIGAAAVLIGGDLFDSPYPSNETCAALRSLITAYKHIKFLAVCGNHDPLYSTAFYADVPDNMYVFPGNITRYELGDISVYGVSLKKQVDVVDPWKGFHGEGRFITLSHGTLDGSESYCLSSATLSNTGAALSLMGHIHKREEHILPGGGRAVYCGCIAGRGFDECGEKGFYEIDTESMRCTFIKSDCPMYSQYKVDISDTYDSASLLSTLQGVQIGDNEIARAVLIGSVRTPYNIVPDALLQYLPQFVEIKDMSKLDINVFSNRDENTLEGEFIRILEKQLKSASDDEKSKILDAMKEGILALR